MSICFTNPTRDYVISLFWFVNKYYFLHSLYVQKNVTLVTETKNPIRKTPFAWPSYVMVHSLEWGIMGFKGKTVDYLPQFSVCGRIFVFIIRLARIRVDGSIRKSTEVSRYSGTNYFQVKSFQPYNNSSKSAVCKHCKQINLLLLWFRK